MARPKKEINWETVERMMEAGCNGVEIGGKFRITADQFYVRFQEQYGERFSGYSRLASEAGIGELRLMQYAKALNNQAPGNMQMLAFLGKVRLKQDDTPIGKIDANNQSVIDIQHRNMELEHENERLRTGIAALQDIP